MPRPMTKEELITTANEQFAKLQKLIDAMTDEQKNAPFSEEMATAGKEAHWGRDKNLRDVVVHLWEWHGLLLRWIEANRGGVAAAFLPAPYTWKTYPEMNVGFWRKHQSTALSDAENMLRESHQKVMSLIAGFSDEELFTKKFFTWTGTTNLGSYCISATASHYDWAIKKLKIHIKR